MRQAQRAMAGLGAVSLLLAACGGTGADGGGSESAVEDNGDGEGADEDTEVAAAKGPEVSLTLGHPFPASHVIQEDVLDPFVEELADATGGTVQIEIIPGGALGPGDAVYENVVAGAQDLGFALHGYTAGRFPIAQVVELPFVAFDATAVDMTEALWDLFEEFDVFQEEYSDTKVLALWTHEPGYIWTSGQQVQTADDLNGLSLRAPGPVSGDLIEALGASSVGMPAPEVYDSIERGVIDGLMIAPNGVVDFRLDEVVDYGVACDCYTSPMFVVMNLEQWETLSSEQQAVIDQIAGRELSIRAAQAYDDELVESMSALEDAGVEIIQLDDDELERWREIGQGPIDAWIQARESDGAPGGEMYDRLVEIRGLG